MDPKSFNEALPLLLQNTKVTKSDETVTEVSAECSFTSSFIGFLGHFPGNPILPAIVQLALVRCLAEKIFNTRLVPKKYKRTKFKAMVKPGQQLVISFQASSKGDEYIGKFKIETSDSLTISTGNFTYVPIDE